jgi:hypothetical protein
MSPGPVTVRWAFRAEARQRGYSIAIPQVLAGSSPRIRGRRRLSGVDQLLLGCLGRPVDVSPHACVAPITARAGFGRPALISSFDDPGYFNTRFRR